jgi:hypothetical protein
MWVHHFPIYPMITCIILQYTHYCMGETPFITLTYYHPTIAHFVPKITISFGHTYPKGLGLVPGCETPGFWVQD